MPKMEAHPDCAICGAPSYVRECPHEAQRLQIALIQARQRWVESRVLEDMTIWVLNQARERILYEFNLCADARRRELEGSLIRIPCYTLYTQHRSRLLPRETMQIEAQISSAERQFQTKINNDWRVCVQKYPEVLDYYWTLVNVRPPGSGQRALGFGGPSRERRRSRGWRSSTDESSRRRGRDRRSRSAGGSGRSRPPTLSPGPRYPNGYHRGHH